ncbi:gliding motility-associated C-terminal domain-containing protein [Hymenobacter lapidarius]|uniref:T9SS type B sorting domain-containing protein n=1 Tax=Hymenobacter lapidarius TaxID=1908237 RepID=UPI000F7732E0|nr:gliding motility-associated C-terminal domain-containing protein [Hymenobacter lapidarius]
MRQTADGGYILGGFIGSSAGGDLTGSIRGNADFWLVKLTAQGAKQWDRTIGGPGTDLLFGLFQTPDGGYAVGGTSDSGVGDDKSEPSRGTGDYWLVKTDAQGVRQWDRTFGGSAYDNLSDVCPGADGGYVLSGTTASGPSADKTEPGRGGADAWLVKVDDQGAKQWDRTLGGPEADVVDRLHPTTDGGYILACSSASGVSADKSEPNLGATQRLDMWPVKLAPPAVRIAGPTVLCPGNPAQLVATATATVVAYRWNTGATTPTLAITLPGTYTVTATFAGGFTSTAAQVVAPFTAVATIGGDSLLCPGRSVVLTAQANGATGLLWSTGATTPSVTLSQPGTYLVVATYPGGCTARAQLRIRAVPAVPAFSLGRDTTVCEGSALVLAAPAGLAPGVAYRWSTGATTPTVRVTQAGTYSVQLVTACDVLTASRTVLHRPCVTIPTIITPNGDRLNEQFVILGLNGNWALQLYNRWGQRVYSTDAYRNEWGPSAAPGAYYYLLTQSGKDLVYKGWVEVVR